MTLKKMEITGKIIITADVHLLPNPQHPINQHFTQFLTTQLTDCSALFIIGDLFESWVGDDINLAQYQGVIQQFKNLTDQGLPIYLLYGNRDFLMGKRFWQATGIHKLSDVVELNANNNQIILAHGDQLCTDDKAYQRMRGWFRNPIIQWLFLKLSKTKRIQIGQKMRQKSSNEGANKTPEMMNVKQQAVEKLFKQHSQANHLIHGHTHQPQHTEFIQNGKLKHRWVLGDWRPEAEYIEINQHIEFRTYWNS